MKKAWILSLLLALLLTGCGSQPDRHPEWNEEWTRFGDRMAVEAPEDFTLGEFNDALSPRGIWYAVWNRGEEPMIILNAEGEEARVYDAQIYLVLKEAGSQEEARANIADWLAQEARSYETGEIRALTAAGQSFSCRELLSAGADNPYSHGAAAFGTRGPLAISAELLCREDFAGDPQAILEGFLSGIHYGEEEG